MVIIIAIIMAVSLGSITVLVSWLIRQDMQFTAKEKNIEINKLSAAEVNNTFLKIKSDFDLLTQLLISTGVKSDLAGGISASYFEQNPQIAALYFSAGSQSGSQQNELLINDQFFIIHGINFFIMESFLRNNQIAFVRAALGETLILNVSPHFNNNLLVMFFPGKTGAGMVLFSPDNLINSFSSGVNQSYVLNNSGDILIHPDNHLMRSAVNVSDLSFIQEIQKSFDINSQIFAETAFGASRNNEISAERGFFWNIIKKITDSTGSFFKNLSNNILKILNNIKTFTISVYNTCADVISKIFNINRSTVNRNTAAAVTDKQDSQISINQIVAYTKLNSSGCIVITSIDYNRIFDGITVTTRLNIYLAIILLLFSILFIWFFARRISIQLNNLIAASQSIGNGEFDIKLNNKRRDEIGVLTEDFNKMSYSLRVFGRFTNKEITLKTINGQIKPGGIPKHATVLFLNIHEFRAKSENIKKFFGDEASNMIVKWLNEYYTSMTECIEKTNGIVDKFIGDIMMAHWGTARTAGNPRQDAFNCIKAALMMRKSLFYMNKKRRFGDLANPMIHIGCGINTGIVTAGQIGTDMHMEYTVIGDPVNVASGIETLTKPLGVDILISEDTWNLIGDKFLTEEMPSMTVRSNGKRIRIFAVINFIKESKGPQSLEEVRKLLGIDAPELESVDINIKQ